MPKPAAQDKLSSSDTLTRDIVRGLYEGRYAPGQRLVEPDLMTRYSVSRSTVREAIQKLTAQGIAQTHLNRGARIRQLDATEARNILLIIQQLIGLAAHQAAQQIDAPGNRVQFTEVLTPLLNPAPDLARFDYARLRNRFHRTMARIGGNAELETILSNMNVHMFAHRLSISPQERSLSYRRIGDAVLAGDSTTAEAEARTHVGRSLELLSQLSFEEGTTAPFNTPAGLRSDF